MLISGMDMRGVAEISIYETLIGGATIARWQFKKKHVDDDCCPECGDVLQDMDEFIGCCNECEGKGGELVQDPEGNWVFRRD